MMAESPIQIVPEQTRLSLEYKHTRPLTACHWEPTSRFIFFGAEDHLVHRFDLSTQTAIPLAAHDSWVRGFASSPDGETFYSGGYDGRLVWWPALAEKPEPLRIVDAHRGWIRALATSPDGKYIASCGNDLVVNVWDAAMGTLVHKFAGHQSHVYQVQFTQDSSTVFSCDLKGLVKSWTIGSGQSRDVATVKALHEYDTTFRADIGGARSIALRTDGRQLALGGITNVSNAFAGVGEIVVALVEPGEGKIDLQLQSKDKIAGAVWGVAHHPGGFWIGLSGGGGGGWLHFWKGDVNHEFFNLKLKSDGRGLSVSPDRTQLAVAHADSFLRTYKLFPG